MSTAYHGFPSNRCCNRPVLLERQWRGAGSPNNMDSQRWAHAVEFL